MTHILIISKGMDSSNSLRDLGKCDSYIYPWAMSKKYIEHPIAVYSKINLAPGAYIFFLFKWKIS